MDKKLDNLIYNAQKKSWMAKLQLSHYINSYHLYNSKNLLLT